MAKATLVPVVPVVQNVILELSPEEANTLLVLAGHVGGNPTHSARRHISAITKALHSVGYLPSKVCSDAEYGASGSVYFLTPEGKIF